MVRTYGDEEGGEGGGTASSAASVAYSVGVGEAGEAMKLFKWPVVRQYFHRGLLWYVRRSLAGGSCLCAGWLTGFNRRSAEQTEVMSFELFLDLLYGGCSGVPVQGLPCRSDADTSEQSASLPSTATMPPRRPMALSCCGLLSPLP